MSAHRSPPLTVLRPVSGDVAGAAPRERLRRLEEERARAADPAERARIDRELARIFESELRQSAPAFAALARAVRARPDDAEARAELRAAAERCGARGPWARVATEAALALPDGAARELRAELAEAVEESPELAEVAWPALLPHYAEELAADPPRAAAALAGLGRLLALPPARPGTARLLEDAARASGDARRLAEVLAVRLEAADPAEEAPLQAELGSLRERLGDLDGAARALARACALAPPAERGELLLRVGVLHARRGDLALAEAWLARAAEGGAPEPLAELARVRARRGDRAGALAALQAQAGREPEAARRRALLLEVANMRAEQGDVAGAADACRQLLAVAPDDPMAAPLLARLLGVAERWDELDEALGREARAADRRGDPAAAADLEVRRAELRRARRGDEPGALAALAEALRRAPRHPSALAAVEALAAGSGPAAEAACDLLEPVYAAERRPERRAAALGWRLARAAEPARRARLLCELARLRAGALGDGPGGFEAAAAALREDPDGEALELVESLAAGAARPASLGALLAECAARARAPARQVALRRAGARLLAPADRAAAADAWRRLLRDLPQDLEALRWLAGWQRERGPAEELAATLRALEVAEPEEAARAAALSELAAVLEGLGDAAGAAACLRRLAALRPGDRGALARLDALCLAAGREAELAQVLAREVELADAAGDAEAARGLRLRLATLAAGPLLDRDGAVSLAAAVLEGEPGSAEARALLEAALAADPGHAAAALALERACERTGDLAGVAAARARRVEACPDSATRRRLLRELAALRTRLGDPPGAFAAAAAAFREDPSDPALRADLAELAGSAGKLGELAELVEAELPRLAPVEQAEAALALGALFEERLGDPERAARAYERARALDREAAARALPRLERLHEAAGRDAALAEVLEERARGAAGAERCELLLRLARLLEERLGRADDALRAYEAARAVDPSRAEPLRALARLDEAAGRRAALCERLAALWAQEPDPAERARLAAQEAELREALGDPAAAAERWRAALEEAGAGWPAATRAERWTHLGELEAGLSGDPARGAACWREALAAEPQYLPALRSLRRACEAAGEREPLAAVLRRLALLEDGEAEGEVRLALAEALLASGERREAAEQGRRALAALSGEPELARLAGLMEEAGSAEGAARVADAQARRAESAEAWMAAADRWARVAGATARQAEALSRALERDPGHRPAWERLRALHAAAGDWRARAALDEAFLPSLASEERRALRRELARAQEERLREPELAFLGWCRALQDDPADAEALAEARRLGAATGQLEELAGVIEDLAEAAGGPARARLLLALGALRDEGLGDAAGALAAFEAAAEAAPADAAPLEALGALQERQGDPAGLAATLERRAEAGGTPGEKAGLLLRVAALHEERLGAAAAAEAALRRAWELAPAEPAPFEALAALLGRLGRFHDLADLLARARDGATSPAARRDLLARLAALRAGELGDEAGAVSAWREAASLDPEDPAPWRRLAELYRAAGRHPEACEALERLAALTPDPQERAEALGSAAALAEEALRDGPRAIALAEALARARPGDPGAAARLGRLYRAERRFEALAALLAARAGEAEGEPALAVHLERAALLEQELGDAEGAAAALRDALREAPDAPEALRRLCELDERAGRHGEAAAGLSRLAELAAPGPERAELLTRLGALHAGRGDPAAAAAAFRAALEAAPGHAPALRAARRLAEGEGDRGRAEQLLEAEARHAPADDEAAALYLELAGRRLEREDGAGAARACGAALERAPGHLGALRLAAGLALSQGDVARAHLLLAALVQGLGARGGEAGADLPGALARLGWASERLGRAEEARAAFQRALEHAPAQPVALAGLARLAAAAGSAEEALRAGEAWRAAEPDAGPEVDALYRAAAARLGRAGVSHA